jgi:hypothetical protein
VVLMVGGTFPGDAHRIDRHLRSSAGRELRRGKSDGIGFAAVFVPGTQLIYGTNQRAQLVAKVLSGTRLHPVG